MTRTHRILTAALALQVVLALAVFILPLLTSATGASAPLLGALTAADITGLSVVDADGNSVDLAKKDGAWVVPGADDYPADTSKIEAFLGRVVGIQTNPLVTRTSASHRQLQVAGDDFQRRLILTLGDGSVRTLFLGTSSAGGGHIRLDGQDEVYLARGLNSFEAGAQVSSWIDTQYFSIAQDTLTAVKIENANGTLEFEKDASGNWTMKGLARGEEFNPNNFTTLLTRLSSLSMSRPLGKAAKPEYGLDAPSAVVTVVAGEKTYTLRVGAKDETDNTYVLGSSESAFIVRAPFFALDDFVNRARGTYLQPTPTPEATATPTASSTPEATPTPAP